MQPIALQQMAIIQQQIQLYIYAIVHPCFAWALDGLHNHQYINKEKR